MPGVGWILRMAWRDSRSQRRRLLGVAFSVVLGVGALAAIHGLKGTVGEAVEREAKALLGSDVQLTSRRAFTPEDEATFRVLADEVARETSFSSMVRMGEGAGLVQVRALTGGYPFYGEVATEPEEGWARAMRGEGVLVEQALLDRFGAKVGDRVGLGGSELEIVGWIRKPLPRSSRFSGFAPELILAGVLLPETGLLDQTSLVFHHRHLRVAGEERIEAVRAAAEGAGWQVQRAEDRRDQLSGAFERFQQFLALMAVAALVLGAVGVAGAVAAQVRRRIEAAALLRCLGCPARAAFAVYGVQAWALGLVGALGGMVLGGLLHAVAVGLAGGLVPFALDPWPSPGILAATGAAGFAVCAAFSLLPLLGLREATPARVLREPGAAGARGAKLGGWLVVGTVGAVAVWGVLMAGEVGVGRAAGMTVGLAVGFGVLAVSAAVAAGVARRAIRPGWPFWLRQGLGSIFRPGNQAMLFVLAMGAATFLLCLVMLVRDSLLARIEVARDPLSPNLYLVDVQPDQVAGVEAAVRAGGFTVLESAPVVTMRIAGVKGVPSRDLEKAGLVPTWILQREFRSSYRGELTESERLLGGSWWEVVSVGADEVAVSLERELARDLGVGVGDWIEVDVVGRPMRARITSLREVDWSRFHLNFFMVFRPGDLEGAPAFYLVAARSPEGGSSGALQRELAEAFSNVSVIDLAMVLERVREILGKIGLVVEGLAWFTAVAGLGAVAGVIANGQEDRLRESVLLRTLGADGATVGRIWMAEFAGLGLVAGLVGVTLAAMGNAALAVWVFKADPWPSPVWLLVFLAGPMGVSVLLGWWLGRGVSRRPTLEELRLLDPGRG